MKPTRKLVSGRIPTEAWQQLQRYAADRAESQDAIVARWVMGQLKRLQRRNAKPPVS